MKIERLYKIEEMVRDILTNDKRAREDDFYLIGQVLKRVKPDLTHVLLGYALNYAKSYNLPPFESITRTRRQIQRENPKLKDKGTEIVRYNETSTYMQYSIEGGGHEKKL